MSSLRRPQWACLLALALYSSALFGCEDRPVAEAPPPDALRGAILIVLDTVRADHVSTSASERRTTPTLEALAQRGVVFEQAISYSPWTMPSMVATLSGSWGSRPGVFVFGRLRRSLVESIRDAGFATAAFTEGAFVSRDFGMDLGFDEYREEEGTVQRLMPGERRDESLDGSIERTFELAEDWLRAHRDERFFLMIHTYEPHTPYVRKTFTESLEPGAVGELFGTEKLPLLRSGKLVFDREDLRYLRALYDGGIFESDRYIAQLLEVLKELGLADRTLLVVSSDHGEELGERDPAAAGDHGHNLYDDLMRVPLLIANPLERYAAPRVAAQVRTIDILPTIADILGVELQTGNGERASAPDGHSLLPLMRAEESTGRIAFGGATRVLPARSFVRYLGYKYIETQPDSALDPERPTPPPRQLYDLSTDPGETRNLIDAEPELAARYQRWLHEHLEAQRAEGPRPDLDAIPPALRARLESLGYLE